MVWPLVIQPQQLGPSKFPDFPSEVLVLIGGKDVVSFFLFPDVRGLAPASVFLLPEPKDD
jgi:hypothetical protein